MFTRVAVFIGAAGLGDMRNERCFTTRIKDTRERIQNCDDAIIIIIIIIRHSRQRRYALTGWRGQEVAIFRQRRHGLLKSSICVPKFPQNEGSPAQIFLLLKKNSDKKKIFRPAKLGYKPATTPLRAIAPSPPYNRRHVG